MSLNPRKQLTKQGVSAGKAFLQKVLGVGLPVAIGGGAFYAVNQNRGQGQEDGSTNTNSSNTNSSNTSNTGNGDTNDSGTGSQADIPTITIDYPERPEIDRDVPPELQTNEIDPGTQRFIELGEKVLDPKYQFLVGQMNLDRQKELRRQAAELQIDQQRVMNKRLIEQENIRAWRDTYKAQVDANAKLALGTAAAIANAMTPNSSYMTVANAAIKNASESI